VQVGLSVPACIQFGLQRLIGTYHAERLMVPARCSDSETALKIGFVDELADSIRSCRGALTWMQDCQLRRWAMSSTRRLARRDLAETFADPGKWLLDDSLQHGSWRNSGRLHALVARLKK